MEDSRIIQLYLQRSEEAIAQTDAKYGNYCFSISRNILSDAEDARESVNDAYLACWNAIPPHIPQKFAAFLGKITRRISLNRFEANRAQKRGGGETVLALEKLTDCLPSRQSVEQTLETEELAQTISRFVRELPDNERRVFVCRYWYIDSIDSIAKQFRFSPSKVKSILFRTRNKLRKILEQEGYSV